MAVKDDRQTEQGTSSVKHDTGDPPDDPARLEITAWPPSISYRGNPNSLLAKLIGYAAIVLVLGGVIGFAIVAVLKAKIWAGLF